MPHRLTQSPSALPPRPFPLAIALRAALAEGYGPTDLRRDVLAGLVVGLVALPLSMALAIASGVPPQFGLYTAIVAGLLIAALGGSRVQVSGPTAAFVVLLAPVSAKYGLGGLALATQMAGLLLLVFGLARFGRFIEFIPYPVTTGFTSGIAVVIATLQLKDCLGLTVAHMPESFPSRVIALWHALPTSRWPDAIAAGATLAVLVLLPRFTKRIPAPLVALPAAALGAYIVGRVWPAYSVATIQDRFSYVLDGVTRPGIPQLAPHFAWPWQLPGPDGAPLKLTLELVRALAGSAFAIAILGAIESLLSAVVADGMTGHKHDPDAELIAQGAGNLAAPFFGGFAATGAIARTATNIRAGARSPIAAMVHAVFILLAILLLAPLLGYLPMASMGALLLVVAWNMAEVRHVAYVLRIAPRNDVLVLITCFSLTVVFDMVVSVTVGVMLAALMFMQRMAEVSGVRLLGEEHPAVQLPLPKGVMVYEMAGPLFFGAAQKAFSSLKAIGREVRCVVLNMTDVPTIDATGLVNLESAISRLHSMRVVVILAGVRGQPAEALERAEIVPVAGRLEIRPDLERAVALARALMALNHAADAGAPVQSSG